MKIFWRTIFSAADSPAIAPYSMLVYLRSAVAGVLISLPVVITFVDNVGYPAPVEGCSMRVGDQNISFNSVWATEIVILCPPPPYPAYSEPAV